MSAGMCDNGASDPAKLIQGALTTAEYELKEGNSRGISRRNWIYTHALCGGTSLRLQGYMKGANSSVYVP